MITYILGCVYMDESEKRKKRVCFTGHRPEKIIASEHTIKDKLKEEIIKAIKEGYCVFISGMARGVDLWAAEIVLQLRSNGYAIKLICALPYEGCEKNWNDEWQKRYHKVISEADYIKCVSPCYSQNCFQIRNEWMVNHSAKIIAVYNGKRGGTQNTLVYSYKKAISISVINLT